MIGFLQATGHTSCSRFALIGVVIIRQYPGGGRAHQKQTQDQVSHFSSFVVATLPESEDSMWAVPKGLSVLLLSKYRFISSLLKIIPLTSSRISLSRVAGGESANSSSYCYEDRAESSHSELQAFTCGNDSDGRVRRAPLAIAEFSRSIC